jgi:hypothetical protein
MWCRVDGEQATQISRSAIRRLHFTATHAGPPLARPFIAFTRRDQCVGGDAGSTGGRTRSSASVRAGCPGVRLELAHARTVQACALGERPCVAASDAATLTLSRVHSDLVALRLPRELAVARRQWLEALDVYALANEALATPSCSGRHLDGCIRAVKIAGAEAKRSLEGGTAALGGGIAAR